MQRKVLPNDDDDDDALQKEKFFRKKKYRSAAKLLNPVSQQQRCRTAAISTTTTPLINNSRQTHEVLTLHCLSNPFDILSTIWEKVSNCEVENLGKNSGKLRSIFGQREELHICGLSLFLGESIVQPKPDAVHVIVGLLAQQTHRTTDGNWKVSFHESVK